MVESQQHQKPHTRHRFGKAFKAGLGKEKLDPWGAFKNRIQKKLNVVKLAEQKVGK